MNKNKNPDFKQFRGHLFWKKRWHSFCSAHQIINKDCPTCAAGSWSNVWSNYVSNLIFKLFPRLWRFWKSKQN